MKTVIWILIPAIFASCTKSGNSAATRLMRTEATDYNGNVFYTEFGYDNQGRIVTMTNHENGDPPVVAVMISYNNEGATLLSHPETDPTYNQTKEVRLAMDNDGRLIKRIEFTHAVAKPPAVQPTEKFSNDTVVCKYDASGFLSRTTESRYDSSWVEPNFYFVSKLSSTVSYTMNAANLIQTDQYAVYPLITNNNGVITVSGGSSEYHNQFKYSKSFPNKTDFKNAAVLNEYALYYEPWLNANFKNMPDQVIRSSIDKDANGTVVFTGTTTIDIDRSYNTDGLLITVTILSQNAPYTLIRYFYGK